MKKKAEAAQGRFHARDYLKTYYPETLEVEKLLAIAKVVQKGYRTSNSLDINKIAKETGVGHETIENVAIFDFQKSIILTLLKAFPRGNARILDVGGGPTIYQHLALSLPAGHITHSEFLKTNREEVLQWLAQEEKAYGWDAYFDLVRRLLKQDKKIVTLLKHQSEEPAGAIATHARSIRKMINATGITDFKKLVRSRIGKDVVHGDVFKKNFGFKDKSQSMFDVITSNFVVEGATSLPEQWEKGVRNVLMHIRPGGFFVQTAVRNATWYQVGDKRVHAVPINEKDINRVCAESGFVIVEQRILDGSDKKAVGYDGMIFTLARKLP